MFGVTTEWHAADPKDQSDEPIDSLGNTDKSFEDWAPLEINEPEEPFFVQ